VCVGVCVCGCGCVWVCVWVCVGVCVGVCACVRVRVYTLCILGLPGFRLSVPVKDHEIKPLKYILRFIFYGLFIDLSSIYIPVPGLPCFFHKIPRR